MAGIINSATYNDFVANVKIEFKRGYDYVQQVAKQLYEVDNVGAGMGDIFRVEEIDGPGLATQVNEGEDFPNDVINLGYSKNIQVYRVALSIPITWWLRHHGKYPQMMQSIYKVGVAVSERVDLDMTHRLTFSTVTTYVNKDGFTIATTTGDGFQLLYTAHTVTGSSGTYRNRIANNPQLSIGGLEAAENLFRQQMIDNAGRRVFPRPDVIVVGTDANQQNIAAKIVNSISPRDESNSGVTNPYRSKYRVLVLPYLDSLASGLFDSTKNKYWFLIDSSNTGLYAKVTENPHITAPTPGSNGENFFNENWTFKASATFGLATLHGRGIVGSTGDGTA